MLAGGWQRARGRRRLAPGVPALLSGAAGARHREATASDKRSVPPDGRVRIALSTSGPVE
jgi:hypothetical protein